MTFATNLSSFSWLETRLSVKASLLRDVRLQPSEIKQPLFQLQAQHSEIKSPLTPMQ